MVVTRGGFSQVVRNAFAGMGFPPDAATVHEFPVEMFVAASDLTPINENIDKVVYGLTEWEPEIQEPGLYAAENITVTGKDYQEAFANMNLLWLKNMWGDGLPLLPATQESVNRILTGTDLSPDTMVGEGKILPRGGIASVEALATVLAMAGGRPEYMPLLIAAVEAFTDPIQTHSAWNSTTSSCYPAFITNGPMAKQIRLSSGYGMLAPNPLYPAGASIGRAVRITLQAMGGAIAGIGTMALYGGPARYTGLVFAEDEAGNPWGPLHVERGFAEGSNAVTVHTVASTVNVGSGVRYGTEEEALATLHFYAGFMSIPNGNYWGAPRYTEGSPGIVFLPRGYAQALANFGWSKEQIKADLWEFSKIPYDQMVRMGQQSRYEDLEVSEGEAAPITLKPENFMVIVAGGEQSGHGYWMQQGSVGGALPVSKEIKLPANWDELLEQAEQDLGPIPAG